MKEDTVVSFRQPGSFSGDPLTDVLRSGARRLLAQAVEDAHLASEGFSSVDDALAAAGIGPGHPSLYPDAGRPDASQDVGPEDGG